MPAPWPMGAVRSRRPSAMCRNCGLNAEWRPTRSSIPPICGNNASRTSRSIAKSSGVGRSRPWEAQVTSLIAASLWASAVCPMDAIAELRIWRRSTTAASRSRQNFPTPPLHSRSRAAMASIERGLRVRDRRRDTRCARDRHVADIGGCEADAGRDREDECHDPDDPADQRSRALPGSPKTGGTGRHHERDEIGRNADGKEKPSRDIA